MRPIIVLALAASLSACASPQVVERVRIVRPDVPAALLDCGPEPQPPGLTCVRDGAPAVCDLDAGRYGVEVRAWGRGCADSLRAVGEVVGHR